MMESILSSLSNKSKYVRSYIKPYVAAMLLTVERKNCTSMARWSNTSITTLYAFLANGDKNIAYMEAYLLKEAQELAAKDPSADLVIDFTQLQKWYARDIENLSYDYNGCTSRSEKGLSIAVASLVGKNKTIPFDFRGWVQKKYAGNKYIKKLEVVKAFIIEIKKVLRFRRLLIDGAFAAEDFLAFLRELNIKFIMRIPSNRKIKKKGVEAQLKEHPALKLMRNERMKSTTAFYKGMRFFFTAHKRNKKDGEKETVYIVSNIKMKAEEYISSYSRRSPIEKVFRTSKQSLGIGQCQVVDAIKQKAHIFAAFVAYTCLEITKVAIGAERPEDIINIIRRDHHKPRHGCNSHEPAVA